MHHHQIVDLCDAIWRDYTDGSLFSGLWHIILTYAYSQYEIYSTPLFNYYWNRDDPSYTLDQHNQRLYRYCTSDLIYYVHKIQNPH